MDRQKSISKLAQCSQCRAHFHPNENQQVRLLRVSLRHAWNHERELSGVRIADQI